MSIFSLRDDGLVTSQDAVSHFSTSTPPPAGDACDVLILHSPQNPSSVLPHLRNSMWSYVYPGKSFGFFSTLYCNSSFVITGENCFDL